MKRTIFFTAVFLSLLGLMESRAQNMQNNRNMEKLKLTEEWDKTFPKSDKVDHSKVTFVNRFGITLAADLYVPKIAVADKSSVLISGEATLRGCPLLSPVNDGSKAMVRKPRSASVCAYSPDDCSFTAPNGPLTAMAGNLSATAIFCN